MKNNIIFGILVLSYFFNSFGYAQHPVVNENNSSIEKISISRERISKYNQDEEFNYTIEVREKNIIDRFYSWVKRTLFYYGQKLFEWIFGLKNATSYFLNFIKALPYIVIAILLYFIFRFLLGTDLIRLKRKKNLKFPMVDMTDEERIMQEEDLKKLITEAIAKKDYRLAVRYHYLSLLKKLVDKDLIDWRPEKTNRDYVSELRSSTFSSDFRKLTFVYDYVWYGNFVPTQNEFSEIALDFSEFKI